MPSFRQVLSGLTVLLIVFFLTGCSSGGDNANVPSGWQSDDGRWWQEGVDTTQVFRNLETLQDMGITEEPQIASLEGTIGQEQFVRAVKEELTPLYRHRPELIDSLFQEHVQADLEDVSIGEEPEKTVKKHRNEAYKTLNDHFQEPRTRLSLGQDVPVIYPDTLRREETSGRVQMQVYLNGEGVPQAVELLEGVHPTLDKIGMNAATRMRWEPAQLMQDGEWVGIPSWVEFIVNFQMPGA